MENTTPFADDPPIRAADFSLSEAQLGELNSVIKRLAQTHAECGEDPADGLTVTFEFSPFGRVIYLRYTGGPPIEIVG